LTSGHDILGGAVSVPKRYPEEFRRKVLDLVAAGRPVAQIANDLQISDQTIYDWRRQELIDTGQLPGLNRAELSELSAGQQAHPGTGDRGSHPEKGP
jgi:transposase-like protein